MLLIPNTYLKFGQNQVKNRWDIVYIGGGGECSMQSNSFVWKYLLTLPKLLPLKSIKSEFPLLMFLINICCHCLLIKSVCLASVMCDLDYYSVERGLFTATNQTELSYRKAITLCPKKKVNLRHPNVVFLRELLRYKIRFVLGCVPTRVCFFLRNF